MVAIRQQFFLLRCDQSLPLAHYPCRIGSIGDRKGKANCNSQLHILFQAALFASTASVLMPIRTWCCLCCLIGQAMSPFASLIYDKAACRGMVTPVLCPSTARSMERNIVLEGSLGLIYASFQPSFVRLHDFVQADSDLNFLAPSLFGRKDPY